MNTARPDTVESQTAEDAFLSGAFGYPCRVLNIPCDIADLAAELRAIPAPAFVWCKLSGRDDPAFAPLRDIGFRVAVEEITYERAPDLPAPAATEPGGFSIRKITRDNAAHHAGIAGQVGALAAENLTTSRFHQDPRVADEIAARIKKCWAMNFFAGKRGQEMYVAMTPHGRIIGFNQVLSTPTQKVIDLICTAGDVRRQGVARALVQAMITPGIRLRVGSQANNAPADAFYRRLGFEPVGASICLHWHSEDGVAA